jgi:Protein of unknown function (DUF1523)
MRRIRITLRVLAILIFGIFLSYVLPQHDVARISGTEIIRQDFSAWNRIFFAQADSGNAEGETRDLRLINSVRKQTVLFGFVRFGDEQTMVYRNEDTGWIWPPYFKFDSSDLQAEAGDLVSTAAQPRWVVVRHYGWRWPFMSIYPNATAIWPVEGPDVRIIPWFNIVFFFCLALGWGFLRAVWRQFRQRTVDPTLTRAGETWDGIEAGVTTQKGRIGRWLETWRRR